MQIRAYWIDQGEFKSQMVNAEIAGVSFSRDDPEVVFHLDHNSDKVRRLTRREIGRFKREGLITGLTDSEVSIAIENAKTVRKQRQAEYDQFVKHMLKEVRKEWKELLFRKLQQ